MAGRLKHFVPAWKRLTSDPAILQIIQGYKIPFVKKVRQVIIPNEPVFSPGEGIIVQELTNQLLHKGAISECNPTEGQFISSYFLVDKSSGEKRFVFNLRKLNSFIEPKHFKMEDMRTVLGLISRGCFMATMDLKDAYFLIPIARSYKKYLRFCFKGKLFQFNCLPFGLCTGPRVFTKLLKPVAHMIRSMGLLSVIYLDDILLLGNSVRDCSLNVQKTKSLVESLGFVLNVDKCQLIPSNERTFLGFVIDSNKFCLEPTEAKKAKIFKLVSSFRDKKVCKIRELAQLMGTLVSVSRAVRYGMLYTKRLEREKYLALKNVQQDFDAKMVLPKILCLHLVWWLEKIGTAKNLIPEGKFHTTIFTDASRSGWGAFSEGARANGWWSADEKEEHINFLELQAVRLLHTSKEFGGIRYPKLSNLSREIWQWCEQRNLWIQASYISSKENVEADKESRRLPLETEWQLADWAFHEITRTFGSFDIDLFASTANAKCSKFISWRRDPDSFAVDAFTVAWGREFFYAFPPFALVLRVLRKVILDEAEGVLVVPYWPTKC